MPTRLWPTVAHAVRVLTRAPGVTTAAVIALAVGIAANTIIFSLVDAALLHPLPFDDPDALVTVNEYSPQSDRTEVSYEDYLDFRAQTGVFEDLGVGNRATLNLTGPAAPEQVSGANVTASLFDVLRVKPFIGRLFTPDDEHPTAAPVVVLTYASWRQRFHSDPAIVGRRVVLDRLPRTIVGVLPPHVRYPVFDMKGEFFSPIGRLGAQLGGRGVRSSSVVGRLRAGVTIGQARAALGSVSANLARIYPASDRDIRVRVDSYRDEVAGSSRALLVALWGAVALLLLVACANAAMLMAALGAARSREFAIRLALGARRSHLLKQLLGESVVLAMSGGIVGVVMAAMGLPLLIVSLPATLPNVADIQLDARVLVFALLTTIATGVLAGLVPAWQAGRGSAFGAVNARQGTSAARPRFRATLVIGQLAITQVLLFGAALLASTLVHLLQTNPGFVPDRVAVAMYYLPDRTYVTQERMAGFHRALLDGAGRLPGVTAAGLLTPPPFGFGQSQLNVMIEGRQEPIAADCFRASPGVRAALGIPLRAGRFFEDHDRRDSEPAAVVDDWFARTYFGAASPIGRRVRLEGSSTWLTIVGVVGHVAVRSLDYAGRPQLYQPLLATSTHFTALMVKTTSDDPMVVMPDVRRVARRLDPDLPLFNAAPMTALMGHTADRQRFGALLVGLFAGVAWLLATVGLAAAVGYGVTIRTRELGIRLALGAEPRALVRGVVRSGALLTLIGLAIGVTAGAGAARAFSALLAGVAPFDGRLIGATAAALLATGLLASYLPARGVARVDPLEALRAE